jgi:hypothetical protein
MGLRKWRRQRVSLGREEDGRLALSGVAQVLPADTDEVAVIPAENIDAHCASSFCGRTQADEALSPPGFFDLARREFVSRSRPPVCDLSEKKCHIA